MANTGEGAGSPRVRSPGPSSPCSPRGVVRFPGGGSEVLDMDEVKRSIQKEQLHRQVDHFIYNYQRKQHEEKNSAKSLLGESKAQRPGSKGDATSEDVSGPKKQELASGLQGVGGCFHRCHPTEGQDRKVLKQWFGRIREYNQTLREQNTAPHLYSFTGDDEEEEIERRTREEHLQFQQQQRQLQQERRRAQRAGLAQKRKSTVGAHKSGGIPTTPKAQVVGGRPLHSHGFMGSGAIDSLTRMASKRVLVPGSPRSARESPGRHADGKPGASPAGGAGSAASFRGTTSAVFVGGPLPTGAHASNSQRKTSSTTTAAGTIEAPTLFKGISTVGHGGHKKDGKVAQCISSTCAFPRF